MKWPFARAATETTEKSAGVHRIVEPGALGIEDYFQVKVEDGSDLIKKGQIEDAIYSSAASFEYQPQLDLVGAEATYGNSLWVYTAVSSIAQKLGAVRIIAGVRKEGEFEDRTDSMLQELIDHPHANLSQSAFVQIWSTFFELAGTDLIALARESGVMSDPAGPLVSLLPLRPSRCEIDPGAEFARRFIHRTSSTGSEVYIHPANACWTRSPNPCNDYWGQSKVSVVAREIKLDRAAMAYNDTALRKGGVPSAKIETEQPITENLRNRIKRYFQRTFGSPDAHGDVVVLSHGLKLSPAGFAPKDMQFLELSESNSRRILRTWKVPPVVAGLFQEASVLANADAQIRLFYDNAVIPSGDFLIDCLNAAMRNVLEIKVGERRERLNPADRWGFRFAWEDVEALKEDDGPRIDRARQDYTAGLITRNEARSIQHLPDREDGDKLVDRFAVVGLPTLVQGGIMTVNEARANLNQPPVDGGDVLLDPLAVLAAGFGGLGGNLALGADGHVRPMLGGMVHTSFHGHSDTAKRLGRASRSALLRRWMGPTRETVQAAFSEQLERVLDRYASVSKSGPSTEWNRAKRAVARKEPFDDILLQLLFPTDEEVAAWRQKTAPGHLLTVLDAAQSRVEGLLDPELQFAIDERSQRITGYMESVFGSRVQRIQETTRESLRKTLLQAFEESLSPRDVKQRIVELFKAQGEGPDNAGTVESRADRITRTELHTALSKGSFESLEQATELGATILKSWLWSGISRQDHAALQSSTSSRPIPIHQRFANGLLHPHEAGADPGQTINCFLPGTLVEGAFVAGLKARYAGPAREIVTARGHRLRVTPNHPVLTAEGWRAAGEIRKGDYLLTDRSQVHGSTQWNPAHQRGPAAIEDVFEAIAAHGRSGLAVVGALDLHGDAVFADADVHRAVLDDGVGDRHEPGRAERIGQLADVPLAAADLALPVPQALGDGGPSISGSSTGDVGGLDLAPDRGGVLLQATPRHVARFGRAAKWNATASEMARQAGSADPAFLADLQHAAAGQVALDQVVDVRDFDWRGHVFDLQSVGGWLMADHVTCSNCGCTTIETVVRPPIVPGA